MFEVVFLRVAFWVCTFCVYFSTCLSLFLQLSQFIFATVSVYFCNCFSLFSHLSQFSVLTFLGGKKNIFVWSFDFFGFLGSTCMAKKPTRHGWKANETRFGKKSEVLKTSESTVWFSRFTVQGLWFMVAQGLALQRLLFQLDFSCEPKNPKYPLPSFFINQKFPNSAT